MSKQKVEILYVLAEALPTFPKGIQKYVMHYFEQVKFLSLTYFTAVWTLDYSYSKNNHVRGVAPKFLENHSHYREGLSYGQTPEAWIQERLGDKTQQEIFLTTCTWETESLDKNED